MSFDAFSPGKWASEKYRSDGVGPAASLVNVAQTLQNIRRNSPDYQSIYDDNIINRANLRNTVRDINSGLIAQKILGKADIAGGKLVANAYDRRADRITGATKNNMWKQLVGRGAGLFLGGIF